MDIILIEGVKILMYLFITIVGGLSILAVFFPNIFRKLFKFMDKKSK